MGCMSESATRVTSSPMAMLGALSGAQLGIAIAAVMAFTVPVHTSKRKDTHAARAIHHSIVAQLDFRELNPAIPATAESNDCGFVSLMVDAISDFGYADSAARVLARAIVSESQTAQLDPLLVAAVVKYESSFRISARSHKGARGLMQVMPATEKALLKTINTAYLSTPEKQLRLGSQYLAELQKRFRGNTYHSLIAYNWGPTNLAIALKRGGRIPSGPVTYAKKILAQQASWKGEMRRQVRLS